MFNRVTLSTLQIDKVEKAEGMFENCESLTDFDVSEFNFENEIEIEGLFKTVNVLNVFKYDSK